MTRKCRITPSFVIDRMDELQRERKSRGYTLPELSALTGVSASMLEQYERETCLPKAENYNKLAKFFCWEVWE